MNTIDLTREELVAVLNALNEALHGIDVSEFQTRLGVTQEEMEAIRIKLDGSLAR